MIDIAHIRPNGPSSHHTPEELVDAAARALPDALFGNDPEVKRLMANHESLLDTLQSLLERRAWLTAQRKQLEAQAKEGQNATKWAVLADCNASDGAFTRTRAAVAELAALNSLLDATSWTMSMLEQRPGAGNEIDRATDAARIALERRVFALKRAHVAEVATTASTQ